MDLSYLNASKIMESITLLCNSRKKIKKTKNTNITDM